MPMMQKTDKLQNYQCPLCKKQLGSQEYQKAINKLEDDAQKNYELKNKRNSEEFEQKLEKLNESHNEKIKYNKQLHGQQLEILLKNTDKSSKQQITMLEKRYDKISKQNSKQFLALEKQLHKQHKINIMQKNRELSKLKEQFKKSYASQLSEKIKEIHQLKKEKIQFKKSIHNDAQAEFGQKEERLKDKLDEKDLQISRFNLEVEELRKSLAQSQSELKGEIGEIDLYAAITHAFPDDFFRRQKRGVSMGDIIQQIRISSGAIDVPIVYDNKKASTITKNDLEKAKKYKKIHGTNYVIIVSNNLPKNSIPNGLYGERDGIILVHPSILIEVIRQIRSGIIEISRLSKSKEDQKVKQFKLYKYVISSEFTMILENLTQINEKLYNLQNKEEKDHNLLWKNRKLLHDQLVKTYNELSGGIESITQQESLLEST